MYLPLDDDDDFFEGLNERSSDEEIIDMILNVLYFSTGQVYIFKKRPEFMTDEKIFQIVRLMEYHDLAHIFGTTYGFNIPLIISNFGSFIFTKGGWRVYTKNQKEKEKHESELRNQEIAATIESATSAKISMYISLCALFITVIISILQFIVPSNSNSRIN